MKYIILTITILFALGSNRLFAQNKHFTENGTITFEKTINMYALLEKQINKDDESYMRPAFESYKKNQKQFKVLKSTLNFANNKTLYTPIEPETATGGFFSDSPMAGQVNTVFTDLSASMVTNQKKVFEETFLVKDSTRKINWKITTETREIAGYTCRRANALVLDSIYVVAFYTDEIPVSGGPELFSGLPGMILGVALPHENMTWFATKVTDMPIEDKALAPPKKGKQVTNKSLYTTLTSVMKNWGEYAKPYLKAFML
ncbi:GLPGLI family protein [Mucilaginibacter lappiensis]|uniref:GLPGLI family protein n=1 Tax=Mucilaginibacter lappiensis TaxID=354630 RepID=A0ABR6PSY9_9SPHI|nr:GLPGLI family protein [Mucilaginibacter lappiensis]MBB6111391.1 GLPGLI family protein [Mucilaginibacter lappiensis]SIR78318.1 GLPGLI family protein [Mucilaginibacter lappiensis]